MYEVAKVIVAGCRVVIPLMPVFLLFMHRHNLNAPKVQLQLGYIYRIYR